MKHSKIVILLVLAIAALPVVALGQQEHYGPGVDHDISAVTIDTPATELVPPSVPFYPSFTFQNFGNYYEDSIRAFYLITDSLALQVYLDSAFITDSLAPDSLYQVIMGSVFVPDSLMKYTAVAFVVLSGDEVPYNDTLLQDFATFEYTGSIEGMITDDNAGGAPLDGAIVTATSLGTTLIDTTVAGSYSFSSAPTGNYTITASKTGYFDSTTSNLELTVGLVLTVNFSLGYPTVVLNPAESVSVSLAPNSIDSSHYLYLNIGGTRDLQYTVEWPEQAAKSKALADSLWGLDLTGITDDNLCLGVEFDGSHLWVSGAASDPSADPNYLYRLDKTGALQDSFPQPAGNGWGWRDLCFDGAYLYAASGDSIEQIDTASGTSTGAKIYAHTSPCRGLAYDPSADCFYTANYSDDIYRVNRDGSLSGSWPNSKNIFGLAWDATAPDGPWLWVFSQDGSPQVQASQFDPVSGNYTGISFQCPAIDPVNACAGGAAFSTGLVPGRGVLLGLLQDETDRLVAYDIRPHNASWLSLSKSSGDTAPPAQDSIRLTFNSTGLDSTATYRAKIMVIDQAGTVRDTVAAILHFPNGIEDTPGDIVYRPGKSSLRLSPNPFCRKTEITVSLNKGTVAGISVYNISGQAVKDLLPSQRLEPGTYKFNWDGTNKNGRILPSGIYFLRLQTGQEQSIRRMALLR
jgi:hypothetical protein